MIYYSQEEIQSANMTIVGNPTVEELAYINGWNDALDAVTDNLGEEEGVLNDA